MDEGVGQVSALPTPAHGEGGWEETLCFGGWEEEVVGPHTAS